MFETDRLLLRAQERTDVEKVRALWNEREVQRTFSVEHGVPLGPHFEETLATWAKEALLYVIIDRKADKEFIGYMGLFNFNRKNRDVLLGIALLPKFWRQGYATEGLQLLVDYAFTELALHRISLRVFASNEAAIKIYRRIGFVQEGVARKANWISGKWEDVIQMAILDEEWAATRSSE